MNATTTGSSWVRIIGITTGALAYTFSATSTLLYYALYPVVRLLAAVWYILAFLSSPFIYIGGVGIDIALIPWRIFASFEVCSPLAPRHLHTLMDMGQPLWYFLGSAVAVGLVFALLLHFTLRAFVVVLRLDKKPPPKPIPATGHDAVSYRKAREERRKHKLEEQERVATQARLIASQPLLQEAVREARRAPVTVSGPTSPMSPVSPTNTFPERPGLLQETILEHSEEDDDDSVF